MALCWSGLLRVYFCLIDMLYFQYVSMYKRRLKGLNLNLVELGGALDDCEDSETEASVHCASI